MPYIKPELREEIEESGPKSAGELNYIISKYIDEYIISMGKDYNTLNEVAGVLACCQMEVYRRITAPYEDTKIIKNGEVFKMSI